MTAPAPRPDPPVTAVGVVVPARDEQDRIGRCLTSLRRALAQTPDGVTTAVAVVLDRCTDATPDRVAALAADWPQVTVLTVPSPGRASDGTPHGRGYPLRVQSLLLQQFFSRTVRNEYVIYADPDDFREYAL